MKIKKENYVIINRLPLQNLYMPNNRTSKYVTKIKDRSERTNRQIHNSSWNILIDILP